MIYKKSARIESKKSIKKELDILLSDNDDKLKIQKMNVLNDIQNKYQIPNSDLVDNYFMSYIKDNFVEVDEFQLKSANTILDEYYAKLLQWEEDYSYYEYY